MARTLQQIDDDLTQLQLQYTLDNTPSRAELANMQLELYKSWNRTAAGLANWLAGTADYVTTTPPGQNGRLGWYPMYDALGNVTWIPSLEAIRGEMSRMRVERRAITSGTTHVITAADEGKTLFLSGPAATTNATVRLPQGVPAGWAVNIVQEGTGGPRLTLAGASNEAGEAAVITNRANAFRTANENALACAIVKRREGGTRSTYVVGGDLVV